MSIFQKIKLNLSWIRMTLVTFFTSGLIIYRLLPVTVIRGVDCISPTSGESLSCFGNSTFELLSWGLTLILILWELIDKKEFGLFYQKVKSLWLIFPLILLAFISSIWSIAPVVTLNQSMILLFATISTAFIILKKSITDFADFLSVYFWVMIILCFLVALVEPSYGLMEAEPYHNAWRGIFWHRNYLGSFMAFGAMTFLFNLLFHQKKSWVRILANSGGLACSVYLVFASQSAAGILTLVLLTGLTILIFLWTRFRSHLKKWHGIAFALLCLVSIVLVLSNLDFIFGLVGRNTSLTGRIPLWKYLFDGYISDRLFLGHGFGAIWSFSQFRVGLQNQLSWGFPVVIGDNGMIDILLHLGIIGGVLVILIFGYAFFVSSKFALVSKTGSAFFPVMSLIFVLMSNITLSMFIELEFFTWFLLIFVIMTSSQTKNSTVIAEN